MLSKNQIKKIKSLELKKNREREGAFVAEGPKIVSDLLAVCTPRLVVATPDWHARYGASVPAPCVTATEDELRKASFQQHPQQVIGIFNIPVHTVGASICSKELCLALDRIQDPGNLGTIIRIADWFGIRTHIRDRPWRRKHLQAGAVGQRPADNGQRRQRGVTRSHGTCQQTAVDTVILYVKRHRQPQRGHSHGRGLRRIQEKARLTTNRQESPWRQKRKQRTGAALHHA